MFSLSTGSVFALSSLFGVSSVLTGSVLFNAVYSATIGWFRGFAFMFGAISMTIPILISGSDYYYLYSYKNTAHDSKTTQIPAIYLERPSAELN